MTKPRPGVMPGRGFPCSVTWQAVAAPLSKRSQPPSLHAGLVTASFHVGAKGRVVLPAALRRAAHIEEGAELVARLVGEGQLLLETKDAVRARVWGAAPQVTG